MMVGWLMLLLAAPQVTAIRVSPLPVYNAESVEMGRLSGTELPHPPLNILGVNEFGYLRVLIGGRELYLRPADVRHTLPVCEGDADVRRESGRDYRAERPIGVRKGGAEDGQECVPR